MAPSAREVPTTHSPTTGPDDLCRVDRLPRYRHTGRTCVLDVSACLVLLAFLLEPRTSAVVAEVLLLFGSRVRSPRHPGRLAHVAQAARLRLGGWRVPWAFAVRWWQLV